MKQLIYIGISILLQVTMFSQNNCNALLKSKLNENTLPADFIVTVQGDIDKLLEAQQQLGIRVRYYAGDIASVQTSLNSIAGLIAQKYVRYIEFRPNRTFVFNDTMVVRNRIKPVKQGLAPLSQAYDGTGVIIGLIDSGIDFNHDDFKDASGNTRVLYLWDQMQTSGSTVPQPYNYGIEWTAAQINASLCTHNDNASYGHGTHVAGIAAGDGSAVGKFEGVAPKADIIMVSLDFTVMSSTATTTYADAINYIFSKATALGKPCVINASVGDYYGSHDGTDLETQLINNLVTAQNGRALVAAAGNGGNSKFHTQTVLTNSDTLYTWFSTSGTDLYYYLYADTNDIKNVKTSIGVNRPNTYFDLGRIPFHNYNDALPVQQIDTLKYNNKRIGIIKSSAAINSFGVYELLYHVKADSMNYLWRIESKGMGKHDSWDFNFISGNLPTSTVYPKIINYTMPDTMYTLASGFQCSDEVITVANYINLNKWTDVFLNPQTSAEIPGKIKESSSSGPTRNNKLKPEVAATGANVFAAMPLSLQNFMITNAPTAVAPGSVHIQGGGTSAAAPVVAGLAGLYLQAHPNASNQQVRQAIINCTYSDGFTGAVPNYLYGNGKLDGMAAMLCTIFTGVEKLELRDGIKTIPNPFQDRVEIDIKKDNKGLLFVYDVNGKCLLQKQIESHYVLSADQINDYKGLLLIRVQTLNGNYSAKIISY